MTSSEKRKNLSSPATVGQLLSDVFKDKKWSDRIELHAAFKLWDRTVGSEIAAIAQPSMIRGRVLWVRVADSVWMQQLHLQKMLLLDKINQQLTGVELTDIRFQLDSSLQEAKKTSAEKPLKVAPSIKEEQEFDSLIDPLQNDAIKSSLKSLWRKLQERRKE
jgi:predicted nucleic acid-binding Zn ribbon protein